MYKVIARQCTKCKFIKVMSDFCNKSENIYGKSTRCKSCDKLKRQKYVDNTANTIVVTSKLCNKCNTEKNIDEYFLDKTRKDGHGAYCKECTNKASKLYRENNTETIRESCKTWRLNNIDHVNEWRKEYYKNNKEHLDECTRISHAKNKEEYKPRRQYLNRVWYSANKEHRNELSHLWYVNNKEKVIEGTHKRREYGFNPINDAFIGAEAHHTWLSDASDMVIYLPNFLHKLCKHDHSKPETMVEINTIALDYWINEYLYQLLYFDEAEKEHEQLILDSLYSGVLSFVEASEILNTTESTIHDIIKATKLNNTSPKE